MKKPIAIITVLIMLLLTGCGTKTPEENKTDKKDPTVTDSAMSNSPYADFLAMEAKYPERAKFPDPEDYKDDWEAYDKALEAWRTSKPAYSATDAKGLTDFVKALTAQMLKNTGSENIIFSPINIYTALSMLAEVTDGNTKQQILTALGVDDTEHLRTQAKSLWDANYTDDGTAKCLLANSFWLNDSLNYNSNTLKTLADNYYANSFSGRMGSNEYNDVLHEWLNENTGGLLKDSANSVNFEAQTILALASTVYFNARWQSEFSADGNTTDTFHSTDGDKECSFMNSLSTMNYFKGDGFSAVTKDMINSGGMRFILPDENTTIDELLASDGFLDYLAYGKSGSEYTDILFSVPKFDVTSDLDLIPTLKNMDITDVFDISEADFSPLTEQKAVVDSAQHSARVMIDEQGCTAAAFTVFTTNGAAIPQKPTVIKLDRPFIFVINGADELPLFIGTVNIP